LNRTFAIQGMHCQNCVNKLTGALSKVPGVSSAHVTLNPPEAHLQMNSEVATEALDTAIRAAGSYSIVPPETSSFAAPAHTEPADKPPSLYPLILIVSYIAGTVILIAWARGAWDWRSMMTDFMAGVFLVFSFFKFLDLRGFVDAYQSYDILARPWRPWGFIYPFLELILGIFYLTHFQLTLTHSITLVLMLLGSVGVFKALLKKHAIRCACLGTALNLPMTTVTLVEDLGMAAMAALALLLPHS
jgi:copper chaperone CopZ